jgi:hypothetical protein
MPFSRRIQATSWIFLGRLQNVGRGLLGRLDDVVELFRCGGELTVELVGRLDLSDLAPRALDRLAHLDEFAQHKACLRLTLRPEHRQLELGDCLEQHLGVGGSVPPRIFSQEPAELCGATPPTGRGIGVPS